MKRSPLKRRTPLAGGGRLRSRSAKRAEFYRKVRGPLTARMLAESPWCEVGPRIAVVTGRGDEWPCELAASALHEIRKRSAGGSLINPANLLRSCDRCNCWVEDHPTAARTVGLVIRRGDPGFDDLGASASERKESA